MDSVSITSINATTGDVTLTFTLSDGTVSKQSFSGLPVNEKAEFIKEVKRICLDFKAGFASNSRAVTVDPQVTALVGKSTNL